MCVHSIFMKRFFVSKSGLNLEITSKTWNRRKRAGNVIFRKNVLKNEKKV